MQKRKGYKFTNKTQSKRAIMSLILGIISLISLFAAIWRTFRAGGQATVGYGFTGLLATLFSLTGLVLAILPIYEKKYYYLIPILGVVVNVLALAWISLILSMGANGV